MLTFTGIYLVKYGPTGEPTKPPNTNHKRIDQWVKPIRKTSEIELASATKNLVKITEPIV